MPTIADLAAASDEEVVALWSGLGYYRRARALREAARRIVAEHGGVFPDRREDVRALPGIGPYTAGAVLSIAHGRSEPLVDGNVARVFCRVFGLEEPLGSSPLRKRLWKLARRLVPPERTLSGSGIDPGDWNQALMELGALVCTPRAPRCLVCPLATRCDAARSGRAGELPRPAQRKPAVNVRLEILFATRDGRVLLVRRPAGGRMARMWELPTCELADDRGSTHGLWPPTHVGSVRGLVVLEELGSVTHGITHHRIRACVRRAAPRSEPSIRAQDPACSGLRWARPDELDQLGLTGLARKVLASPFARLR